MDIDVSEFTDDELVELAAAVSEEQSRREILSQIPVRIEQVEKNAAEEVASLSMSYLVARDGPGSSEWVSPEGAHDAYPKDWVVLFEGREWVSVIPANVWMPGEAGWREMPTSGGPAPWVQPLGAVDSYAKGDTVTHNGKTWESNIDANVWEPPEQWLDVTPAPEPPPAPVVPAWKQPTGGHDAYKIGDRVSFGGKTYESVINGNTWSPTAYPAGWKVV